MRRKRAISVWRDQAVENGQQPCLTASQQKVYEHLLEGRTVKQIAHDLYLAKNTVHWHVTAIYRHFSVTSHAELVAQRLRMLSCEHGTPRDSNPPTSIE